MAVNIVVPSEGQGFTSTLVSWYVRAGDRVRFGDPLCQVESDKASFDVESPLDGVVLAIHYDEGDAVPRAGVLAIVGQEGEPLQPVPVLPDAVPVPSSAVRRPISPKALRMAREQGIDLRCIADSPIRCAHVASRLRTERARYTVAARDVAREMGVDPTLEGSGMGGRITLDDIDRANAGASETIGGIRKRISDRMLASLQKTAQWTLTSDANVETALRLKERLAESHHLTLNDLVCYAAARALVQCPDLNAHFASDRLTRFSGVRLGVAVDTPRGLLVPVVCNAHKLRLVRLSKEIHRLAAGCREGTIMPSDLSGATFTVSNLGMYGVCWFTPILNPPEVGILGVGAPRLLPVRGKEGIAFEDRIQLSLTVNHQVIDGAQAARFLQQLADNLANIDILAHVDDGVG